MSICETAPMTHARARTQIAVVMAQMMTKAIFFIRLSPIFAGARIMPGDALFGAGRWFFKSTRRPEAASQTTACTCRFVLVMEDGALAHVDIVGLQRLSCHRVLVNTMTVYPSHLFTISNAGPGTATILRQWSPNPSAALQAQSSGRLRED